jgi:hypothetical protein
MLKECPNLPTLPFKSEFFYSKVFYKWKKQSSSTFNWTNEWKMRKNFDEFWSFKTTKDVVDVMAETKRLVENTIHLHTIVERFK